MAWGIPCNDDVSAAPVDAVCAANHDMLVSMIADLVTPLYQLTTENDATIKRVKTMFSRQLNSTLRENETRLAFIAGQLVQPINDLISRNWGLLTHVESEVGNVEIPQEPVTLISIDTGIESEEGPESRDTARGESGGGLGAMPTSFQAVTPPSAAAVATVTYSGAPARPVYPSLAAALATVGMDAAAVDDPYGIDDWAWGGPYD